MYIYNVTVNVDESIHQDWLQWLQKEHIPEMIATGKFTKALVTRVMVEEELGGITYAIQYRCPNKETLDKYYKENAETLRAKSAQFKDKFVAFRTELQILSEHG